VVIQFGVKQVLVVHGGGGATAVAHIVKDPVVPAKPNIIIKTVDPGVKPVAAI
jgi:hypothetical protein